MGRFSFAGRRLLQTIPLLAVVVFVVYLLARLIPGDPAHALLGLHATPARVAALNRELGLDRPLFSGYARYLWQALHGNLGNSVREQTPVGAIIGKRLGVTLLLLGVSLLVSLLISVSAALIAARGRDRLPDHAIRAVSVLGLSVPTFWLGLVLVSFVALPSGWFPVSGFGGDLIEHIHAIILPALALAIAIVPTQIRALRAALIGVLDSDFVAALRATGLPERRVIFRHVLPNAIPALLTLVAVQAGLLLFAEVVVENTFALPGIGQALVQAVSERDYPVIQGVTLICALLVICSNLLADLLHTAIDPRVEIP